MLFIPLEVQYIYELSFAFYEGLRRKVHKISRVVIFIRGTDLNNYHRHRQMRSPENLVKRFFEVINHSCHENSENEVVLYLLDVTCSPEFNLSQVAHQPQDVFEANRQCKLHGFQSANVAIVKLLFVFHERVHEIPSHGEQITRWVPFSRLDSPSSKTEGQDKLREVLETAAHSFQSYDIIVIGSLLQSMNAVLIFIKGEVSEGKVNSYYRH